MLSLTKIISSKGKILCKIKLTFQLNCFETVCNNIFTNSLLLITINVAQACTLFNQLVRILDRLLLIEKASCLSNVIYLHQFVLMLYIILWSMQGRNTFKCVSCLLLLAGALMAAATDITFNFQGYMAVLANDVLTSLYLIMVKNTPASNGLSTTGKG